ncbi:MAG: hypothetical protein QGF46_06800 [Planctomycetota bacterium]|jgi:hypothetical protein|nr:hypothetical protein [Planctomycetota bacterium]
MTYRLPFVLFLTLCLSPSVFAQQQDLEHLKSVLEQRSAARIAAAENAWQLQGEKFLASGDRNLLEQLASYKPEIQGPVFAAIERCLASKELASQLPRLLQLLATVLDQSSAAKLLFLFDKLPANERPSVAYSIIKHGSSVTQASTLLYLPSANPRLAQSIVESSLLYGTQSQIPELSEKIDYQGFEPVELGAILGLLAEREFDSEFSYQSSSLQINNIDFRIGLLELMIAKPWSDSASYLIKESIEDGLQPSSQEIKKLALLAFESGASEFKWSRHQNKLQRFLKAEPKHPLATDVAYTLHRLGDRKGTSYLLDGPEQEYIDNDGVWPYAVALGKLQVELGLHSDAYKVFHRSYTKGVKNEQVRRRMKRQDFVWAARAAAGAKRPSEAFDWLGNSGLSMDELRQVGKFPEFEPYLDRDQFKALFSIEN